MTISYEEIRDLVLREARYLDDKQWDDWLTCYTRDAEYWMPSWDDDNALTTNPKTEISLIYYGCRDGLEDRVFRIKTERSSASMPEPRTLHTISNIEILDPGQEACEIRYNWVTHSYRYKTVDTYFGVSHCGLVRDTDGILKFNRKKIVLKNDYIHHVVDIYHV